MTCSDTDLCEGTIRLGEMISNETATSCSDERTVKESVPVYTTYTANTTNKIQYLQWKQEC